MTRAEPDAIVEVRFLTTAEGGRMKPVLGTDFRTVFEIDGENHSGCFIAPDPLVMELGCTYEVPVFFLYPEHVLPKLAVGKAFTVWEGRTIASGKIVRVLRRS